MLLHCQSGFAVSGSACGFFAASAGNGSPLIGILEIPLALSSGNCSFAAARTAEDRGDCPRSEVVDRRPTNPEFRFRFVIEPSTPRTRYLQPQLKPRFMQRESVSVAGGKNWGELGGFSGAVYRVVRGRGVDCSSLIGCKPLWLDAW